MLANYTYYITTYKGCLIPDETTFSRIVIQANAEINRLTHGKVANLNTIPDSVNNAICAIAEIIHRQELSNSSTGIVASESVGPHSKTYAIKTKTDKEYEKEIYNMASRFLCGTGLLYAGLR